MHITDYSTESIEASAIRKELLEGTRSLSSLAFELKIDSAFLVSGNYCNQKVIGLSELEKFYISEIYRITKLPAEDLYESLHTYFPTLTLGSVNDCIQHYSRCRVRKRNINTFQGVIKSTSKLKCPI